MADQIIEMYAMGTSTCELRLRLRKWYCMLGMTFLLSLMIEITQLLTRVGSFDVDDLILNTSGGILGYLLFYIINKVRRKWNGA